LGFDFGFYGNTFNSIRFCTNGFLSFTSTANTWTNTAIPSASAPLDLLAPFWDDLYFPSGGNAYFYTNNVDSAIVSYVNVPHYSSGGPYTFEVIILSNGSIIYQYQTINTPDNSATIGIQNFDGTDGLQVVFDAVYVHANLAIRFGSSWLSASPTSGNVNPASQTQIAVTLDASNLSGGTHTGNVMITSNDPDTPSITVPVTLLVQGGAPQPDIDIAISSISDTLSQGSQTVRDLVIRNRGTADLRVSLTATEFPVMAGNRTTGPGSNALSDEGKADIPKPAGKNPAGAPELLNIWLFISPAADTIPAGDSLIAQVTLNAGSITPGIHSGQIGVTSNDPDEPTANLPVTLLVTAGGVPDINLSDLSFTDTVQTGGTKAETLLVGNLGTASLHYGLHDNRAWIIESPDTGMVAPSGTATVVVRFSAGALTPGTYAGQINVNSDDPDEPLFILPVTLVVTSGGGSCQYVIGDVNSSGIFNGIDVTYSVGYFKGGPPPPYSCDCPPHGMLFVAGDVNGSCVFNGIDVTYMVTYFKGGPAPSPCPDCPPVPQGVSTVIGDGPKIEETAR
jgi:hypothetical protein